MEAQEGDIHEFFHGSDFLVGIQDEFIDDDVADEVAAYGGAESIQ